MSNPTLIFIHIPKTGGTSILQSLKYKDIITGHIPYGSHELLNRPYRYATLLRDPVERAWSAFEYIKTTGPSHLGWRFVKDNCFQDFICNYHPLKNGMVKQLCGLSVYYDGEVTQEHLELGIQNLYKIEYVGITSRIAIFFNKIKLDYGITGELKHLLSGKSIKINSLDESIIELALKYNKLDSQIYSIAKEICI